MTIERSYKPGLDGVVAAETTLSSVDGQKGELTFAGFPVEELAAKATFEEVCWLLWDLGDLPAMSELDTFRKQLASFRELPPATIECLYQVAKEVEATAIRLRDQYKPGRNLRTNVEFFMALLLHGLGLESALFTPTFAAGRVAGWIGHCFEQQRSGRLIRPDSVYVGRTGRTWVPLDQR